MRGQSHCSTPAYRRGQTGRGSCANQTVFAEFRFAQRLPGVLAGGKDHGLIRLPRSGQTPCHSGQLLLFTPFLLGPNRTTTPTTCHQKLVTVLLFYFSDP